MSEERESNGHDRRKIGDLEYQRETDKETSPPTTLPDIDPRVVASPPTYAVGSDQANAAHAPTVASAEVSTGRGNLPSQIGRFSYVRMLGKGSFGTVVQVWDPELQTHRAVKLP